MSKKFFAVPDNPGWYEWRAGSPEQFNRAVLGEMFIRRESDNVARIRLTPQERLSNLNGVMHGGALMALIDTAMFAGAIFVTDQHEQRGVTVDAQIQFLSPGQMDQPVDVLAELTRETGKLFFTRGLVVQGETRVCSYTGLLRKIS
ncbi:PaaI family thioesterase [Croceicoccus gelatinilyticus]|uniref:PaaI family thioesterase n=1 Tax=Croceicoccus gelatinilyticus TaxID=2835536 RepID=UPI001BCDD17F|nr:PaaI family thioesterase [Croceicoccus gelatinilyticus]MBS7668611.1 PaaI family thioesterase [Croceicoccus gelatinilyticus]